MRLARGLCETLCEMSSSSPTGMLHARTAAHARRLRAAIGDPPWRELRLLSGGESEGALPR